MARYVAFLRGMNLGKRRLTNEALVAAFDGLGFTAVTPFLASGNVVFDTKKQALATLGAKIERGLQAALDYRVPTFLRTAEDVRRVAAHEPFGERLLRGTTKNVQVLLLRASPTREAAREVLSFASVEDHLVFGSEELYWLPKGNMSASELDLASIERAIGPTTMRAQRTLARLAAKFLDAI